MEKILARRRIFIELIWQVKIAVIKNNNINED